ncbi:hypothetical protein EYF80_053561 [Liparis tanakae]|uniref:Uncharacterized protein n=1 Tax=Liparis tanakae TaxID=230148 RepID=A0A4Z2F7G4_9TELE|nr:hypothetical protein EYF80_053561 [Liparis tanakae]
MDKRHTPSIITTGRRVRTPQQNKMDPTMFISSMATMWKVKTSEWLIVVPERCCLHRWKPR